MTTDRHGGQSALLVGLIAGARGSGDMGGIVRSGSKVGSKYKTLFASTNDAYCPTLRGVSPKTQLPDDVGCVLEIVIDGLDLLAVEEATRRGMHAAAHAGAVCITAGNYGGSLGQFQIHLHKVL